VIGLLTRPNRGESTRPDGLGESLWRAVLLSSLNGESDSGRGAESPYSSFHSVAYDRLEAIHLRGIAARLTLWPIRRACISLHALALWIELVDGVTAGCGDCFACSGCCLFTVRRTNILPWHRVS